ncbi:MAG: 30S ribosomal protein S6 [Thermoanaerobaculia bacterium]|nr:MAG: 30S ribosomal protein S6 [Thermoanaerobaculia bacterium]MBZ0103553.1 30S ribosomal protein S6 [Thermoanaerobaculia bacterium]
MRTYELAIVADPRLSDDEFSALVEEYKQMITQRGGEVVREELWGKRKLAYPIRKLSEGRYVFLYLQMEPTTSALIPEVELRLGQNDKVLRYLTVRTDLDLKRAAGRARPGQPVRTIHSDPSESVADSAVVPEASPDADSAPDSAEEA